MIYLGGNNLVIAVCLVIVFLNDIINDFSVCIADLTWEIVYFHDYCQRWKVLLGQICDGNKWDKKGKKCERNRVVNKSLKE